MNSSTLNSPTNSESLVVESRRNEVESVEAPTASDSDTAQTTKCTKIPSFLNRFKSKRGNKKPTAQCREKRVFRVFIIFRHWGRKKRRLTIIEKCRSEVDCADPENSNFKTTDWENTMRRRGKIQFTRKKKSCRGVVLVGDDRVIGDCLPMRSRLKTRFDKIMRRHRRRSSAAKSFYSVQCSHSRRSIDIKKENFAVGGILRPSSALKTNKRSGRKAKDLSDRVSVHTHLMPSVAPWKQNQKFNKARKKLLKDCRGSKCVVPAVEKCRKWLDEYSHPGGSRQTEDGRIGRINLSEPFVYPRERKNLKQKFLKVLKKFKKAGVIENPSIAKKLSSGDTGALDMIEDLMDRLSLGKSSQYFEEIVEGISLNEEEEDSDLSMSVITQAKPTLKPYFTENKTQRPSLVQDGETSATRSVYCEKCGPSNIRLRCPSSVLQTDLS
ncbi:hypothetical protein GE061_007183 [Apolygus lucorum]|uniref:Uncharacterized protein n=1 Tax=Apolygus lucorum TaxID=248454 RepID=A0A6A4IZR8_APOLU|nr:hypothetical protein GE061_007183 [Apolygus lucorum]